MLFCYLVKNTALMRKSIISFATAIQNNNEKISVVRPLYVTEKINTSRKNVKNFRRYIVATALPATDVVGKFKTLELYVDL